MKKKPTVVVNLRKRSTKSVLDEIEGLIPPDEFKELLYKIHREGENVLDSLAVMKKVVRIVEEKPPKPIHKIGDILLLRVHRQPDIFLSVTEINKVDEEYCLLRFLDDGDDATVSWYGFDEGNALPKISTVKELKRFLSR